MNGRRWQSVVRIDINIEEERFAIATSSQEVHFEVLELKDIRNGADLSDLFRSHVKGVLNPRVIVSIDVPAFAQIQFIWTNNPDNVIRPISAIETFRPARVDKFKGCVARSGP